jgi:cyanate permease
VALVMPTLGASGAAVAVSTTTAAAILGRLLTGIVVDRTDPRFVAAATLGVQVFGVMLLAWTPSAAVAYSGCTLFGLGVGNLTTLPGLIVAAEWPTEQFGALVALAVGINQLTFAFGPSLVGVVRDWSGGYAPALSVCAVLQVAAATLVLLGRSPSRTGSLAH